MIRQVIRGVVALVAITLVLESVSGRQPAIADKIYVQNKKDGTTKTYEGTLKLSAAGLQILAPDGKLLLTTSPAEIAKVAPGELAGIDRSMILSLLASEDKKTKADYLKARDGYLELQKKTATAPERTKRFVEFKVAMMMTRVADESADDEKWSEQAADAIKAWTGFLAEFKSGWEVWPAANTVTRLMAESNKFDDVARTWGRLTKKDADLPPDMRLQAGMLEIDAQIRQKLYPSALESAKTLFTAAAAGSTKDRLEIYQIAAKAGADAAYLEGVKALESKIATTKDPVVRGTGYGMMGELYLAAGKPRDAMWAFLWVETVYNTDRDDAFRAMCRLVEVFKAQDDDDRVKAYRDKIRRFRATF